MNIYCCRNYFTDVMSRWGQILTLWLRSCFCGPFGLLDHYCIALCCTQRIGELETRSHTGIRNLWQVERLHLKQNRQFKIHHYCTYILYLISLLKAYVASHSFCYGCHLMFWVLFEISVFFRGK